MPRGGVGKPFPPGKSGNPKGSSAKAKTLGKLRKLTSDELAAITERILLGERDVLQSIDSDPSASFLQVWTARLLQQSMLDGDVAAYRAILDRVCGKPKETVSVGGDTASGPVRIDYRTREEKLERLAVLQAARQQVGDYGHSVAKPDKGSKAEGLDASGGPRDSGHPDTLPQAE